MDFPESGYCQCGCWEMRQPGLIEMALVGGVAEPVAAVNWMLPNRQLNVV